MRLLRNVVGAVLYHQEDSKWTLCGVIRWGRGLHLLMGEGMRDTFTTRFFADGYAGCFRQKKQPLDAPVTYEANDSIVFTQGGYAHLYGQGKVNYQQIELADVITMNMDSSTVYAHGVEDSLGVKTEHRFSRMEKPPYETNTIRYNFKSKKGIISNVVSQQGEGYVTGNNAKRR